jgi:hypothetical protein
MKMSEAELARIDHDGPLIRCMVADGLKPATIAVSLDIFVERLLEWAAVRGVDMGTARPRQERPTRAPQPDKPVLHRRQPAAASGALSAADAAFAAAVRRSGGGFADARVSAEPVFRRLPPAGSGLIGYGAAAS